MASEATLHRLEAEFDSPPQSIRAFVGALEEGANVPYLLRFRRREMGPLTEDRMRALEERLHVLEEMDARKEAIREQAREKGVLDEKLERTLATTYDQDLLDDIYQSLRPRRRTQAMQMEEKGLGALALAIQHRQLGDRSLQEVAREYLSEEHGLDSVEKVLEGVALILAERYGTDPGVRAVFRRELSRGILRALPVAPGRKGAQKYKAFFDFSEPVRKIPAGRMLALRRAEWEGILELQLVLPEGRELEILRREFAADLQEDSLLRAYLDLVFKTAYEQHIHRPCERDVRRRIKEKADREAVRNSARGLRSQLMAPPLGHKRVVALRATHVTLWAACLDESGSVVAHHTVEAGVRSQPSGSRRKEKKKPRRKVAEEPAPGGTPPEAGMPPAAEAEPAQPEPEPEPEVGATENAAEPAEPAPATGETPPPQQDPGTADDAPSGDTPSEQPAAGHETGTGDAPTEKPGTGDETGTGDAPAEQPGTGDETGTGDAPAEEPGTDDETGTGDAPAEQPAGDPAGTGHAPEVAAPGRTSEEIAAADEAARTAARRWLVDFLREHRPAAVAIPHGRRQSATEKIVMPAIEELGEDERPMVVPVDEAASTIHATSAAGRRALHGVEVGVRTAVSLGRRLQDPLHELVGMDPHHLGLGHTLDEVHQGLLQRHMDAVVESCVAAVGTELNGADQDALVRVPGIDRDLAKRIVSHRKKLGGFRNLEQLREVEGVDDAVFRHCAGFLRILGGDQPLDATPLHPDQYALAARIAEAIGKPAEELIGAGRLQVDPSAIAGAAAEEVRDVARALAHAHEDPRGELHQAHNPGITAIGQLQNNMSLRGRITNLTDFGAFVDLGIGQDGLVHLSQIPAGRLRDPERALRVGEVVEVWVLHVDLEKRKIGLTMRRPRAEGEDARRSRGRRKVSGRERGDRPPRERGGRERRPHRDRDRDGGRDGRRPGGRPRVITVESEREAPDVRGHKGELTSLAGLRDLLEKRPGSDQDSSRKS